MKGFRNGVFKFSQYCRLGSELNTDLCLKNRGFKPYKTVILDCRWKWCLYTSISRLGTFRPETLLTHWICFEAGIFERARSLHEFVTYANLLFLQVALWPPKWLKLLIVLLCQARLLQFFKMLLAGSYCSTIAKMVVLKLKSLPICV